MTSELHAKFQEAVQRGDPSSVAQLLRQHPEWVRLADEQGKTALHWAAEADRYEVALVLLDAGAQIEARTAWGATPLDWAATMGAARVGELLLSRGASGGTLVVAAGLGRVDEVRSTIQSGADLQGHRRRGAPAQPDEDWPDDSAHIHGDVVSDALYAAARNGHSALVEFLLDRGANVDAKGVFGGTALHWAAINGHESTVDLLVARGASLVIRDARFRAKPAEWAIEGGHFEIAAKLRTSGEPA
jgi:ankyrin repeat protein